MINATFNTILNYCFWDFKNTLFLYILHINSWKQYKDTQGCIYKVDIYNTITFEINPSKLFIIYL